MSAKKEELPPVVVNVIVELPVNEAFELFTRGISRWWPLATHSVGEDKARSVHFETREGGRIYEVDEDGTEHDWGEVLECKPPTRLAFTWRPGRPETMKQNIEVMFAADGDVTHVELVHRDWEVFDNRAEEMRENYTAGWAHVLGECYAVEAGSDH